MEYVVLLRGINVGGKNAVSMPVLREALEKAGLQDVRTYINTGNILCKTTKSASALAKLVSKVIQDNFGITISILIRTKTQFNKVLASLPDSWKNDSTMKSDVLFYDGKIERAYVFEKLAKPGVDTIKYYADVILWSVNRKHVTKSGLMKLASNKVYKQMTIRNVNTVRKIAQLLEA